MGACIEPDHLSIITEFCSLGSLHDILHKKKIKLEFSKKIRIMFESALGMVKNFLEFS